MGKPLRVLFVEDSADDAELMIRELRRGGYEPEFERVDTPEGLAAALEKCQWDVILADYTLPYFSAPAAIEMVKQKGLDVPFIIVSGSIGEEKAVELVRAGVTDYLLKDRLARLAPAVERAIRESRARRESKLTEEALRRNEARYRMLFENAQDGIGLADAETGRLVDCNQALCRMVERSKTELLGQPQSILHPPEDLTDGQSSTFREHQTRDPGQVVEDRLLSKSGKLVPVEIRAARIQVNGRDCLLGIFRDITARRKSEQALRDAEEQFRQAQKLESIGRLAGGVAHDMNNALGAIMGYCELILPGLAGEDPLAKDIEGIRKAADRAAGLTRQLLAFSRKQVLQPKVLDLNAVVAEMEEMLRRLIGEDVELRAVLSPDIGRVLADPSQIEQVLMNLAVNARDAMPGGGRLTMETRNVDLDEEYARQHTSVVPGPYVLLAVSDTGCGMDAQTQARIFEPFFTTKERGKGTGLGLSTVYGIVKQSGGNIWVYSEPGKGTTFKIYLPRVAASTTAVVEPLPGHGRSADGGSETILLVEDEELLRNLVARSLGLQGYRVLEAPGGGEALLTCERHDGPIHLLLTDVVMPQMSGRELANRLSAIRPEMRVLYMSGYTDNAIVHHGVLDAGVFFVEKPFTTAGLAHKVREVLEAPR